MQTNNKKAQRIKTIQTSILQRFMNEGEIENLLKNYRGSFRGGSKNRIANLEAPLKRAEKVAIKAYLSDKPMKEIDAELKSTSAGLILGRAQRAGLKLLWQNKDKIGLEKILEEF